MLHMHHSLLEAPVYHRIVNIVPDNLSAVAAPPPLWASVPSALIRGPSTFTCLRRVSLPF